ncbi:MAG: SDR family oxidoreductase [Acidobacteria bacterium]|nr:SDR family oxidoreductase [Acidobacteriota bacterium]
MNLQIEGKVAVVTAASRGLGRAVAEALAAEGARVAICSRDREAITAAAEAIRDATGSDVLALECDVTNPAAVARFAATVLDHCGTAHILFANAGGPPPGSVLDFGADDYATAVELNLLSTIRLVNVFLPAMRRQRWGRIIASASISVKQPLPQLALSNVSRAGVVAYIKTLSSQVAAENITANTIAPGYIMTERVEQLLADRAQRENRLVDEVRTDLESAIPARRIGRPDEFGALVAFLASEPAAYITGTTLLIDGGMYQGLM